MKSDQNSIEKTIEKTNLEQNDGRGAQERHLGSMRVIGTIDFGRRGGPILIRRVNPSPPEARTAGGRADGLFGLSWPGLA